MAHTWSKSKPGGRKRASGGSPGRHVRPCTSAAAPSFPGPGSAHGGGGVCSQAGGLLGRTSLGTPARACRPYYATGLGRKDSEGLPGNGERQGWGQGGEARGPALGPLRGRPPLLWASSPATRRNGQDSILGTTFYDAKGTGALSCLKCAVTRKQGTCAHPKQALALPWTLTFPPCAQEGLRGRQGDRWSPPSPGDFSGGSWNHAISQDCRLSGNHKTRPHHGFREGRRALLPWPPQRAASG